MGFVCIVILCGSSLANGDLRHLRIRAHRMFEAVVSLLNIFLFKRRMLQVRITIFAGFLLLGYCLVYGLFVYRFLGRFDGSQFIFSWATSLPVIAMILDYLAFRGIMKDEMLIRTLDRLR